MNVTRRGLQIVLPLLGVLSSGQALGAWTADASAEVGSRYQDNVTLSPTIEDDAIATTGNVQGEVRRVTENSELSAVAGVTYLDYSSYSGQEDLNNENLAYGDLRGEWRGDRVVWRLLASGRRDVLLETIGVIRDPLDTAGAAGNPSAGSATGGIAGGNNIDQGVSSGSTVDQGSVEQQVRRYDISANPSVSYLLTERTSATVGYGYQRLDYHNGAQAGLENSHANLVTLQLSHELSEVDSVRLSTSAGRFEPENDSSTDAYGATVGWVHRFSEAAGGSIDVGANESDQDGDSNVGLSLSVRGFRETESGGIFLQAQRSLMPSGSGTLNETDRLLFGYERSLSETVALRLNVDAYETSSSTDSTNNDDRSYVSAGPEVRWAFSPNFSVGANYRYEWVDRQSDPGSASGNAIGVFISYQPQREI